MITPINNVSYTPKIALQKSQKQPQLRLRPQLTVDTVSFGNLNPDLMSLSDESIYNHVNDAIKKGDILGEGGEAVIYKIGDTGYCVKKSLYVEPSDLESLKPLFTRKVTPQDKVNHVVARFAQSITIMPIIEGNPVKTVFMSEEEACKIAEEIIQFPQSAFSNFLYQINDAYKKGMMFDCNWANVLANPKMKTFTVIDFYRNDPSCPEPARHLAYMYASLTHGNTTDRQHKVIAEKVMNAGLEEMKPGVKLCCNIDQLGFPNLIKIFDDLDLFEGKKYPKLLRSLMEKIKDLKYQDVRGIDVTNELNHQIKVVKSIMHQLTRI